MMLFLRIIKVLAAVVFVAMLGLAIVNMPSRVASADADADGPVSMREYDAPGVRCFKLQQSFSCIPDLRDRDDTGDVPAGTVQLNARSAT